MKIGLYFGSFNPIHFGHLIIGNFVAQYTELEQVWFVVSPHNPLKKTTSLLNEYHRLHLVGMAVEDSPLLKASDIEFKLPRPSFTIDTLTHLQEKYPNHTFSLIMGSDSFENLPRWKNYELLKRNYSFYVYNRPCFAIRDAPLSNVVVLDAPLLEISATALRGMIKAGKSIQYLVPEKIREEIEKGQYYKL